MKFIAIIAALALLLAANPPPQRPIPPVPPTPPLFNNSLQPQPPVWQQIQGPMDRSTGRILDQPTFDLNELQRENAEQLGKIPPSQIRDFEIERERQLRLDQKAWQQRPAPATPQQLDLKEYELYLNAGLSTTALQVQADEQALEKAKSRRDQQLITAQNQRDAAIQQRPGDRPRIEADYAQRFQQIQQQYEKNREKILGYAPATQPTRK